MIETRSSGSRYDHREAYDVLYSKEGIHQTNSFYAWILSLLKPIPGRVLLDVSCGEGQLVYLAAKRGLKAHGVDISGEAIEIAKKKVPEACLQVANGEDLPYPESSFDYVTSIGSLEHYEDMEKGAKELARVMKPDAKACILLPNVYGLFWQIRTVWKTGDLSDDGQPIQRYGTVNEWIRLLNRNGLVVVKVHKYDYDLPRTYADFRTILRHPKRMLYLMLSPLVPFNLANNFVFLCTKAQD